MSAKNRPVFVVAIPVNWNNHTVKPGASVGVYQPDDDGDYMGHPEYYVTVVQVLEVERGDPDMVTVLAYKED